VCVCSVVLLFCCVCIFEGRPWHWETLLAKALAGVRVCVCVLLCVSVFLKGDPGTVKTLLAKALAGVHVCCCV
jgi:hypothetical protein